MRRLAIKETDLGLPGPERRSASSGCTTTCRFRWQATDDGPTRRRRLFAYDGVLEQEAVPRGSGTEVVAKFGWEVKDLLQSISAHFPIIAIRDKTVLRGWHVVAPVVASIRWHTAANPSCAPRGGGPPLLQHPYRRADDRRLCAGEAGGCSRLGQVAIMRGVAGVFRFDRKRPDKSMARRMADSMSMAHSLEVRIPLRDHSLAEAVIGIPGRHKLKGGRSKPLLAAALGAILSQIVALATKRTFTFHWETWLKGQLRQEVEETLISGDGLLDMYSTWGK